MAKFDPQSKIMKMQGKDYLEVKWRLVWFRDEHPKGGIITEIIQDGLIKATIIDGEGKVLATGHGGAKAQGVAKSRPFEGAETAAIGRALAHAGYGTQFTGEDEGEHLADSPVETKKPTSSRRAELVKRYNTLSDKASTAGLHSIPVVTAEMTEAEIEAMGIELSERIKKEGK